MFISFCLFFAQLLDEVVRFLLGGNRYDKSFKRFKAIRHTRHRPNPGIAILAEFAAGAGETIVMGRFDVPTMIYGLLQGVACEVIFLIFRYKSRSAAVAMLAGLMAAIITLPLDFAYGYLNELSGWNLTLYIVFRLIGGLLVAGLLSYYIVKALDQTGVTKLFRPASKKDYDNL